MSDLISRQVAIDAVYEAFCYAYCDNCEKNLDEDLCGDCHRKYQNWSALKKTIEKVINVLLSAQPEIIRCCKCCFWDRDTLRHQFNDFRDWNEAECMILSDRDPYHEINRYTEADDFCSRAERREE